MAQSAQESVPLSKENVGPEAGEAFGRLSDTINSLLIIQQTPTTMQSYTLSRPLNRSIINREKETPPLDCRGAWGPRVSLHHRPARRR